MDKLKMMSADGVEGNIEKIGALFPNCVTERLDENGKVEKAIDFEMLKQELSRVVVDGAEERYQFTWPDKKKSILLANAPINKTLRPVVCDEQVPTGADTSGQPYMSSGSVGRNGEAGKFDSENLYIEGDNLDALKLLQETYMGKIKMIYIDPPYNTGNDFVYKDNFEQNADEYMENSGQLDEQGNRLFQNNESNGRFHTDWLNMIYQRLKLAKDLLTDDGVIFISIDDNEQANLKKVCDEVFGASNFVACLAIENNPKGRKNCKYLSINHENCIIYCKNYNYGNGFYNIVPKEGMKRDSKGLYSSGQRVLVGKCSNKIADKIESDKFYYVYYRENFPLKITKIIDSTLVNYKLYSSVNELGQILENTYTIDKLLELYNSDDLIFNENTIYEKDRNTNKQQKTLINSTNYYDLKTESANFNDDDFDLKKLFSMPKNVQYIEMLMKLKTNDNDIILDFFSGSATTAHAVMQLNAEDGGNRKFIMVQLPEVTDEKTEAYNDGYKNICEIGKERIRRAGKKILGNAQCNNAKFAIKDTKQEDMFDEQNQPSSILPPTSSILPPTSSISSTLDIGFRVLKLDTTNMKDVYYRAENYSQSLLDNLEGNIKADRKPQDLLLQVMLDMGVLLSSKIEEKNFTMQNGQCVMLDEDNKPSSSHLPSSISHLPLQTSSISHLPSYTVFIVGDYSSNIQPNLIACFDDNLSNEVVTAIAKMKPLYAVFRDSSFANDSVATNFEQIFTTYSPTTTRKVL